MNFDEYERKFEALYADFAATVKLILEKALAASDDFHPQSIQHRAKTAKSLKVRLEQAGLLGSDIIEQERKDLAGVRLIFYTNNDVDRFLKSRLINENFEIDRSAIKVHHPIDENNETRYRAIHYTVSLKEDRAKLPEYAKFKGIRCEIQIQTILNHAWSETSHDIIYKDKPREGFGTKAMEAITNRFNKIMDNYLLPAGYEFQQIQHDYERLQQGKELFDRDAIQALGAAENNNQRHAILTSLKENALPNYDDIPAIYGDLIHPLIEAAKEARASAPAPINTTFGDLPGKTTADVTNLVIDIFDLLRYVDVERTFNALCELYRTEGNNEVRKHIVDTVRSLAQHNLAAWKIVGPGVQGALIDAIERLDAESRKTVRPLLAAVWEMALGSDAEGTEWHADSVTLSSGSVIVSDALKLIRGKAMNGLFSLFDTAASDEERREIIHMLREAGRTPSRSEPSNELRQLALHDSTKIVEFLIANRASLSYEIMETLEHEFLFDYFRAREIAGVEGDKFQCKAATERLCTAILSFRDAVNADATYVRYKMLVGFESVFPQHWEDEDFDYSEAEKFRKEQAERYIGEISEAKKTEWFALIERCAATRSDDLATFPLFGSFLVRFAETKPSLADELLDRGGEAAFNFLPAFLNGLFQSDARTLYERRVDHYLEEGKHLTSLARHWRTSKPDRPDFIAAVLKRAIAAEDAVAVIECLVFAIEGGNDKGVPNKHVFLVPALEFLTARKDARWIGGAWFLDQTKAFCAALSESEAQLVLDNLLALNKIDHRAERLLVMIAEKHLTAVWRYLATRVSTGTETKEGVRYEAFPYQFHGLEKQLSRDAKIALQTIQCLFSEDQDLFRFRGGRLLSTAFPHCPPELACGLAETVTSGTNADADFVLAVLENYRGHPATHEILKQVVARYSTDESKMAHVEVSLDSTGVVAGPHGYANAMREKREAMRPWLGDARPEVRAFAEAHIRALDLRIAEEHRRVEAEQELRKLQFEKDGGG